MQTKKIIGFMGEVDGCRQATDYLVHIGFHKTSISNKVREVAKYLCKMEDEDLTEEMITNIRNRGYRVNRLYWLNLVLASVPENKDKVAIEDMRLEDLLPKTVSTYLIVNSSFNAEDAPPDIEIIKNEGNKSNFLDSLKKKLEKHA